MRVNQIYYIEQQDDGGWSVKDASTGMAARQQDIPTTNFMDIEEAQDVAKSLSGHRRVRALRL